MNKTSNSRPENITKKDYFIIIIVSITIMIIWVIGFWGAIYFQDISYRDTMNFLKNIPEMLGYIATIDTFLLALFAIKNGLFSRGGTEFYPKLYGEKKLSYILNRKNDDYSKIVNSIYTLLNSGQGESNEYFKRVYKLQHKSSEFKKVWNDYNYLHAKQNKSEKQEIYYQKLEEYVFRSVYEEIT